MRGSSQQGAAIVKEPLGAYPRKCLKRSGHRCVRSAEDNLEFRTSDLQLLCAVGLQSIKTIASLQVIVAKK
jgi:hypothetical protein